MASSETLDRPRYDPVREYIAQRRQEGVTYLEDPGPPYDERESKVAQNFLERVAGDERYPDAGVFLVAHLRRKRVTSFIYPVNSVIPVCGVLPKPNTSELHEVVRAETGWRQMSTFLDTDSRTDDGKRYAVFHWKRDDITPEKVIPEFEKFAENSPDGVIISDIGGYFAPVLADLKAKLGDKLLGVVEDTKNGEDKYKKLPSLPCPVISVATSPLKELENYYVGQDIEYAAGQLLRPLGKYREGMRAINIGFGPIGESITKATERSGLDTTVYDDNPDKNNTATEKGHNISPSLEDVLPTADVIFSATGNKGLKKEHFPLLKRGAEIVLATSGDDELDIEGLQYDYELFPAGDGNRMLCMSRSSDHYFYLPNGLKTINFTIRPRANFAMLPLQGEIIRSLQKIARTKGELPHEILTLPQDERQRIAAIYGEQFATYSPDADFQEILEHMKKI